MLLRSKLVELGISNRKMCEILDKEYNIRTADGKRVSDCIFSQSISGKRNGDKAVRIKNACWDYVNKHGAKEKV
jgi:hypothetical protein